MMKINRSQIIALLAFLAIGVWFLLNSGKKQSVTTPINSTITEPRKPSVVYRPVQAIPHAMSLKLFGRTEASREVSIKAETSGIIMTTPIAEGSYVKRGTIVCKQDINARQANVEQAKALLKTREVELSAAQKLVNRGFASETQALGAQAALDSARATVKQAEIELENINLRAPFSGIYDKNIAEVGDYLNPGQPCGLLIQLNPLIAVINLTESQIGLIKTGLKADVELATGEKVQGTVKFIESRANPATRTFKAEIAIPNPKMQLKAGVSASIKVKGNLTLAHRIPGHILALNDDGVVGVKYLDTQDQVHFAITQTIDEDQNGIWVTGLPETSRIIVKGQDYVAPGISVFATNENAL